MRIVQVANFYGPRSGGLRTALHHLGGGYVARGHDVTLVVPGHVAAEERMPNGVVRITLRAPRVPGTGGYRVVDPWRVGRLLERLEPETLEVSDRLTLRGLGRWAAERGVPSVVISHERLDRLLEQFLLPASTARWVADRANAAMAADYDLVVCATAFAREEFDRIGAHNVARVPLGVDLATFSPLRHSTGLRSQLAGPGETLLVHCGRLSSEKHPERSIDTLAALIDARSRARLVIAGDGPRRASLQRRAAGLPVTFLGFVPERAVVARLLATADVALAPGPHETFGLAALESLASGTPAIVSGSSALREIVQPGCGAAVADDPGAFADGVLHVLGTSEAGRPALPGPAPSSSAGPRPSTACSLLTRPAELVGRKPRVA